MNFNPFPILETERLILRNIMHTDVEDIFVMRSDPNVMQYIPRPLAQNLDDAMELIETINNFVFKNEKINWALALKENNKLIGLCGYPNVYEQHNRAEIGYSLSTEWHRKGYMTEAIKCVLKYGFEQMNLHSVLAIIDEENVASGGILQSIGFRKEAFFLEDFLYNSNYRNSIHFGMLKKEAVALGLCIE